MLVRTDDPQGGRTATVVAVALEQRGQVCVEAVGDGGADPEHRADYANLPTMPAAPPPDSVEMATFPTGGTYKVGSLCDLRVDRESATFLDGRTDGAARRCKLWARPRDEQPDPYFALLAGDMSMPVTFNLGPLRLVADGAADGVAAGPARRRAGCASTSRVGRCTGSGSTRTPR